MEIIKGIAAVFIRVTGNYWKASWIEHGKLKCKYIESRTDPATLTFAQIKRKKGMSKNDILRFIGAPIGEK